MGFTASEWLKHLGWITCQGWAHHPCTSCQETPCNLMHLCLFVLTVICCVCSWFSLDFFISWLKLSGLNLLLLFLRNFWVSLFFLTLFSCCFATLCEHMHCFHFACCCIYNLSSIGKKLMIYRVMKWTAGS